MLEVEMKELRKAVEDFYSITNIKIVLYDDRRNILYSYPEDMCEFCSIVRSNPKLAEKCLGCDNIGFDKCDQLRRPYIYKCHMQLTEAVAPIIENGLIIGYMMMGQVLSDTGAHSVSDCATETAKKYGLSAEKMLRGLNSLKIVDEKFIESAVSMMSMCACYLYHNNIVKNKSDLQTYQLMDYIETHLNENLSVKEICKKLFISKSKLYHLSQNAFGMGVSDYIRNRRLEEAKKLLCKTEKNIGLIAEETGFKDANYFTRVFKKSEGMLPSKYRKVN